MIKTIELSDGKKIVLQSTAASPIIYSNQFHSDFFKDVILLVKKLSEMGELGDNFDIRKLSYEAIEKIDLTLLYRIAWVFAKNADRSVGDMETWLSQFEDFPINEISKAIQELLEGLFKTTKK